MLTRNKPFYSILYQYDEYSFKEHQHYIENNINDHISDPLKNDFANTVYDNLNIGWAPDKGIQNQFKSSNKSPSSAFPMEEAYCSKSLDVRTSDAVSRFFELIEGSLMDYSLVKHVSCW